MQPNSDAANMTAPERLERLWRATGSPPNDSALREKMKEIISSVESWLIEAATNPQMVLRVVQFLLVHPERREELRRPEVTTVLDQCSKWVSIAGGEQEIRLAQHLLLAGYPNPPHSRALLIPALLQFHIRANIRQMKHPEPNPLLDWLDRVCAPTYRDPPLRELSQLLYWERSRYSLTLKKQYRELSEEEIIYFCAEDIASIIKVSGFDSSGSPTEWFDLPPLASFYAEALRALNIDLGKKRPFYDWTKELFDVLNKRREAPRLAKQFSKHVEVEPLGLPVSWIRMRVENEKSYPQLLDNMQKIGIDNEEMELNDYVKLLLEEVLLDYYLYALNHSLPAPSGTPIKPALVG